MSSSRPDASHFAPTPSALPGTADIPLIIANAGPAIHATNFWDTSLAARGGMFASFYAGACRLLIPNRVPGLDVQELVEAAAAARELLVSVVGHPQTQGLALELMWEDDSAAPYVIQLSRQQTDRLPTSSEHGRPLAVSVWLRGFRGQPFCILDQSARLRVVSRVPYLKAWGG